VSLVAVPGDGGSDPIGSGWNWNDRGTQRNCDQFLIGSCPTSRYGRASATPGPSFDGYFRPDRRRHCSAFSARPLNRPCLVPHLSPAYLVPHLSPAYLVLRLCQACLSLRLTPASLFPLLSFPYADHNAPADWSSQPLPFSYLPLSASPLCSPVSLPVCYRRFHWE
jgi:hypothetical protein